VLEEFADTQDVNLSGGTTEFSESVSIELQGATHSLKLAAD
jgi:hypothetical protein